MAYSCQNCGATADNSTNLCNPASDSAEPASKFCGASPEQVCEEKLTAMKYACDNCGSVSADAEHLCSPSLID